MRKRGPAWVGLVIVLGLAGCSGREETEQAGAEITQAAPAQSGAEGRGAELAAAPAAFSQCRSCHSIEPGRQMIGPSLAGIFGTRAGDVAGYNFSPAMQKADIVWDEATLDAYIKAPREVVPGTKMTYPGLKNDERRAEVVAYLKSLGA